DPAAFPDVLMTSTLGTGIRRLPAGDAAPAVAASPAVIDQVFGQPVGAAPRQGPSRAASPVLAVGAAWAAELPSAATTPVRGAAAAGDHGGRHRADGRGGRAERIPAANTRAHQHAHTAAKRWRRHVEGVDLFFGILGKE